MSENLKQKTIQGMKWSIIERFSVQGVSFILGLIIARLLSPSDYGVLAMLAIFMSVSGAFVDSGFSTALIRKIDRTETDNSTVFYFNIGVGVLAYFILFFCAPLIADFYNTPILKPVTRVVALNLFLSSLCVVQQALLTSKIDFRTQAKISLVAAIVSGLAGAFLAYFGFGVWALVAQALTSAVIRTVLLWLLVRWRPTMPFSRQSFHELFSFGSKMLASGLLDTIYNNIYTIVIGKVFSAKSLGFYSRADQFAQFPSSNITSILQRVTFPILSTIQHDDERLQANYRRILRLSAFIIFPLMVGLAAVAKPMILTLLTAKWSGTILLLQILCFSLMWYPIHAINLNLLQVKGRSDLFLRLEVIKKILGCSILCVTIPMGLVAMCWGSVVTSLICLAINTHYTGKLIHVGLFKQLGDLVPILVHSLVMGLVVFLVVQCISTMIIQLCVGISIGGIFYIGSAYLMKSQDFAYLLDIIHKE